MIRADYRGRGGEGSRGDDVMVLRREMQKEVQFGTERQLEDGDKGEHSSIRWQSIGNLWNFGKSRRLEHVCT